MLHRVVLLPFCCSCCYKLQERQYVQWNFLICTASPLRDKLWENVSPSVFFFNKINFSTQADLGLIWRVCRLEPVEGKCFLYHLLYLTVNKKNHHMVYFSVQMSPSLLVTASLFYWNVATHTARDVSPNGLDYRKHRSCVQNVRTSPTWVLKDRQMWKISNPISTC